MYAVRWANSQNSRQTAAVRAEGPPSDAVIYDHLKGLETVGLYPLLPTEETWFLAIDFDKSDWHQDALAYLNACRK